MKLHLLCIICSSSAFMVSTGVENPKQLKQPLYIACIFTWVTGLLGFMSLTAVLNFVLDIRLNPLPMDQVDAYFVPISVLGAISTILMQAGIAVVILIRTLRLLKVSQIDDSKTRKVTFVYIQSV